MNRVNGGILRTAFWLGTAVLCLCVLGAGDVEAAKQPKVEICHFDADTGLYKKLSVSGNAIQKHMDNHEDIAPGTGTLDENCNEVIAPEVLAVAYIDKNRNGVYDSSTDVDIALLLDTADDDVPSVGDTVELGQYPLSFDPCPSSTEPCTEVGNTNPPQDILVTTIGIDAPDNLQLETDTGALVGWSNFAEIDDFRYQADNNEPPVMQITDDFTTLSSVDVIFISIENDTMGEVNPSDNHVEDRFENTVDDYFINVEFP